MKCPLADLSLAAWAQVLSECQALPDWANLDNRSYWRIVEKLALAPEADSASLATYFQPHSAHC
jgi:hypothetical protein